MIMHTRRTQRILVVLLATAVGGWLSVGCTGERADGLSQVRVGYLPVSTSLPVFVADAYGFFAEEGVGIVLERYANSNLMLAALLAGEIDATAVIADEPMLVSASTSGRGQFYVYLQEILTADRPFDSILVATDSDINDVTDLRGKTLACFPGSQLQLYSRLILNHGGVDPETVNIQQLPPANMLVALAAGTVDALLALEPIGTLGTHLGLARVLLKAPISKAVNEGRPFPAASFLVASEWAKADPETTAAFVRAVHRAVGALESDYAAAAKLYPTFTPIPESIADEVVITQFRGPGEFDSEGLQREIELLASLGLLAQEIQPEDLFFEWGEK